MSTLYETDFYAWANEQAALLRAGKLAAADIEHIAEEIESMGKTEKRELQNRLSVLLMHLLKWQFQPEGRCTSWRLTVEVQRDDVSDHLAENPSLKSSLASTIEAAYRRARLNAARETNLPKTIFPMECPYTYQQATDPDFWPD